MHDTIRVQLGRHVIDGRHIPTGEKVHEKQYRMDVRKVEHSFGELHLLNTVHVNAQHGSGYVERHLDLSLHRTSCHFQGTNADRFSLQSCFLDWKYARIMRIGTKTLEIMSWHHISCRF